LSTRGLGGIIGAPRTTVETPWHPHALTDGLAVMGAAGPLAFTAAIVGVAIAQLAYPPRQVRSGGQR
jgi:hypothetical protein